MVPQARARTTPATGPDRPAESLQPRQHPGRHDPRSEDRHDPTRRHHPADHRPARRADHHRPPPQRRRDQPVQGLRQQRRSSSRRLPVLLRYCSAMASSVIRSPVRQRAATIVTNGRGPGPVSITAATSSPRRRRDECLESRIWQVVLCRKRFSIRASRRVLFFGRAAVVGVHARRTSNRTWPMGRPGGRRTHRRCARLARTHDPGRSVRVPDQLRR
jgi:hypothetical protein